MLSSTTSVSNIPSISEPILYSNRLDLPNSANVDVIRFARGRCFVSFYSLITPYIIFWSLKSPRGLCKQVYLIHRCLIVLHDVCQLLQSASFLENLINLEGNELENTIGAVEVMCTLLKLSSSLVSLYVRHSIYRLESPIAFLRVLPIIFSAYRAEVGFRKCYLTKDR